ncbi:MAG: Lacal_2735 family protein [Rubripirellula sp.]|nr:Lacal_2735 family protein [Rubripirellula sp.]
MFGSSGNSREKFQEKYNQLMEESYRLSHINRKKSDLKRGEAEEVGKQLDELDKKSRS